MNLLIILSGDWAQTPITKKSIKKGFLFYLYNKLYHLN